VAGVVMAQDVDGLLHIPMTSVAPTIDGMMDDVWYSVGNTYCLLPDPENSLERDDWFDTWCEFRVMYDADKIYLYLTFLDDIINEEFGDWQGDGAEIYFDADNSKTEEAYDGIDDVQTRFNIIEAGDLSLIDIGYGTGANWGLTVEAFEFEGMETDYGFDLEVSGLLDDLQLVPGEEFGFDVQTNDGDDAARDQMFRWWAESNNEWQHASLFGTAMMTPGRVVGDVLDVQKAGFTPVIDGVMEDGWKTIPMVSGPKFDSGTSIELTDDWWDAQMDFRVAWDDDNLYMFFNFIDDILNTEGGNHEYDGVEIYFDADNSKTEEAYDGIDDVQLRFNLGETETSEIDVGYGSSANWGLSTDAMAYVAQENDAGDGWDLEVSIPLDDLQLVANEEFGFDAQMNDADDATRDIMRRWWSNDNNEWIHANLFGTAMLVSTAVGDAPAQVEDFSLAQNYPNPFNPATNIKYSVQSRSHVKLAVYDMLGHEVAVLVNEVQNAGSQLVSFDAGNLPSGMYFYKLEAGDQVFTKKMTLLK
jgi:hypothetical protein